MAIIEVNDITKEFQLGQLHGIKLGLQRVRARLSGHPLPERTSFKALDHVDFKVEPGEVLGIIGSNGAGKSTLLKILSRITIPSSGSVTVRGKVAPLIEVGAGLVGDLTGRENIYLNAAILGMRRAEIRKRFDEIVAFAELEEFIDTPIKRYSSGMQIRLGFSIATSVNADILIVDEVLAVGDLAFQRKSFDRMESLIRRDGRTVLVVGHNLRQLERLCSRIIVLDQGRILKDGAPAESCKAYIELSNRKTREYVEAPRTRNDQIMCTDELEVDRVEIYSGVGHTPAREIPIGGPVRIGVNFRAHSAIDAMEVVVGFHTPDFVYIASASTITPGIKYGISPGAHYVECGIDKLSLLPGVYAVRVAFLDKHSRVIWYGENLIFFNVSSGDIEPSRLPVLGFVNMDVSWRMRTADTGLLVPLSANSAERRERHTKAS